MNKIGEIIIKTETGAEKERYPAIYGAQIFFKDGDKVNVGDKILEWDPFAMPILSEVSGTVAYEDMIVGSTVAEEVDSVTGLTHKSCY
jgi:DNA-directed RNA polymerase subunit beta'